MPHVLLATLHSHELVQLARVPLVGERVHVGTWAHQARVRLVVHTPTARFAAIAYVVHCEDEHSEQVRTRTMYLVENVGPVQLSGRAPKNERR